MYSNSRYSSAALRLPLLGVGVLASFILTACGGKEVVEVPDVPRPIKILELSDKALDLEIKLPGQVLAGRQANMAFEVSGLMTEIKVDEGDRVAAGDVLAILDASDFEAMRNAARAQLEAAKLDADRAQALFEREATSKQRLDVAVSNYEVALSGFERAEKAYNDTFLKSPIAGVVAKVFVDDFVNVAAKQDILTVQDNSFLRVSVDVPEVFSALAKRDQTMAERTEEVKPTISLTSVPSREFPAEIWALSSTADPATRTFAATLRFVPPDDVNFLILPGMTAVLTVHPPMRGVVSTDSFTVPSHAVVGSESGEPFVWVVDPDTMLVSRLAVKTGDLNGDEIEISADALSVGTKVAISGVQLLTEGAEVRQYND